MSKKHDFLRSEQNRDKHPESKMTGSESAVQEQQRRDSVQNVSPQDRQEAHSGKYANDHNKMGNSEPTQIHEGRRTPKSRHDNETHIGGQNQIRVREHTRPAGESHGPSGG